MRTLVIIIVLALVIMIARRLLAKSTQTPVSRKPANEHMVQCANCGIFIPEREALQRAGRFYCSQAHLDEDLHE